MPLETATYVNELVATNPANTESVRQGDDHIRLIKAALLNTFPDLSGPVGIDGTPGFIPVGGIILWSGSIVSIPAGWALCDGTLGTPNLRDRFVVGAGTTYAVGANGGAATVTLTLAQIPSHTHGVGTLATDTEPAHSHGHTFAVAGASLSGYFDIATTNTSGTDFIRNATGIVSEGSSGSTTNKLSNSNPSDDMIRLTIDASHGHSLTGGISSAGSHTHSISGSTGSIGSGSSHENRPPYYALAYIMKI